MTEGNFEKPRFHPRTIVPEVPEGMILVKFHGEPALIPSRGEDELMFGKSGFTLRQVEALVDLEQKRKRRKLLDNLDALPYPEQYAICRFYASHPEEF